MLVATVLLALGDLAAGGLRPGDQRRARLAEAGEVDAALAKTQDAADANPLSSDPLLIQAAIETEAGARTTRARRSSRRC